MAFAVAVSGRLFQAGLDPVERILVRIRPATLSKTPEDLQLEYGVARDIASIQGIAPFDLKMLGGPQASSVS